MEILGVVHNPIMELRLGEEILSQKSSSDAQYTNTLIEFFLLFLSLSHQAFAGPLPTESKEPLSVLLKQWLWISSLRPGIVSY